MKLQIVFLVGMIIELCFVPLLEAKRSFGITRSRNKNNKPSVRRNQHGHEFDDNPVPPVHHPKPSAPKVEKPISHTPNAPQGPPPAYPGMGHHNAPAYGAPPAYSPSYSNPPGYSAYNQPRFGQTPGAFNQPQYNQFGGGAGMMPMGVMPMAAMGGGYGGGYGNRGGMGSGIMTNLFAGLAGYQLARAFSGGHHQRDREVIVIDNRQAVNPNPVDTPNTDQMTQPILPPESPSTVDPTTAEIPPVTQVGPANNEYNYYGLPQYGIPLYGYSMPSQITDYYQTAIISVPQPPHEQTPQPSR